MCTQVREQCRRGKDLNDFGMQKEDSDLLMAAVEETSSKSVRHQPNHSVGRARIHKEYSRAAYIDRSFHVHAQL